MADISRNRKKRNFISAFVATYKTGEALEHFTKQGLSSVHTFIKDTVGDLPLCSTQCSQHFGHTHTDSWCSTCTRWRVELETFLPPTVHRNWRDTHSWQWANNEQDITEVFILPQFRNSEINLQDMSTIFNIWNRCLQFQRHIVQLLEPLKESRNVLVHVSNIKHMKLTNARKRLIFQQIDNVVNNPDIQIAIPKYDKLLKTLKELKKGELFQNDIKQSLKASGMENSDIIAKIDALSSSLDDTNRRISSSLEDTSRRIDTLHCTLIVFIISLAFAIIVGLVYMDQSSGFNVQQIEASNTGKGIE